MILVDVNHYRVNELQAVDKTLEQVVRYYLDKARRQETLDRSVMDKPYGLDVILSLVIGFFEDL